MIQAFDQEHRLAEDHSNLQASVQVELQAEGLAMHLAVVLVAVLAAIQAKIQVFAKAIVDQVDPVVVELVQVQVLEEEVSMAQNQSFHRRYG